MVYSFLKAIYTLCLEKGQILKFLAKYFSFSTVSSTLHWTSIKLTEILVFNFHGFYLSGMGHPQPLWATSARAPPRSQ